MSKNTRSLFAIADHVTPKIDEGGGGIHIE